MGCLCDEVRQIVWCCIDVFSSECFNSTCYTLSYWKPFSPKPTLPSWIHNITMREQSAISIQSSLEPHLKEQSNVRRINSPYLIGYLIMGWGSYWLIHLVRWFSWTRCSPSSGLADAAITYWCQQPAGCKLHCMSFVISAFLCLGFHIPHYSPPLPLLFLTSVFHNMAHFAPFSLPFSSSPPAA